MLGPIETSDEDPASITPAAVSLPPSPAGTPAPILPSSQPPGSTSELISQSAPQAAVPSPLSSSLPELSQMTLNEASAASGSSSEFSMRTTGAPQRVPSPNPRRAPTSPRRPPDWAGGVRSVWGKLSSNATAALTAVQGAYDGVARDLSKSLAASTDDGESGVNAGELKSRDQLNSPWGEDSSPSTSRAPSSYTVASSNPWDTARDKPTMPSLFLDNPWNTGRSQSPSHAPLLKEVPFGATPSGLPHDPTVSHPKPIDPGRSSILGLPKEVSPPVPVTQTSSVNDSPSKVTQTDRSQPTPPAERRPENIDPLGVGIL